jgi:predicted RNase H-like HicB family nuclease
MTINLFGGIPMNNLYTAVTKKDGNWWVGWVSEVPGVNCQERTHKELLKSLKITLKEALDFNRNDALISAGNDYQEEQIAL